MEHFSESSFCIIYRVTSGIAMVFVVLGFIISILGVTIATENDCMCVVESGVYMTMENILSSVKELPVGECYRRYPDPDILPAIRIKRGFQVLIMIFVSWLIGCKT